MGTVGMTGSGAGNCVMVIVMEVCVIRQVILDVGVVGVRLRLWMGGMVMEVGGATIPTALLLVVGAI